MAQDPKKQKELNAAIEQMNSLLQQAQVRGNAFKLESEAIAELQRSIIDGQIKTVAQIDAAIKATAKLNTEQQKVKKTALESADAYDQMLDLTYDLTKAQGKNNQELMAAAKKSQQILDDLESKLEAEIKSGKISKKLAAEKLAEARATNDMAQSLGKLAEADIAKPFHDMQKAGADAFGQLASAFGDFQGMINGFQMGGILGAFTVIASVIGASVNAAKEFTTRINDLSKATGISYTQAAALNDEAIKIGASMDYIGVSSKDVEDTFATLANTLGSSALISAELAGGVSQIAVAFGISNDEAAETQATLMQMGLSGQEALEAQQDIAAEAFKAGVDQGKVLKDISKSAKINSKFFGGDIKRLKAAAIQAAKLGMELDDMAAVADSLLDFENSITKQFEFQALSGKNVNLDKARELALTGDIAGATQEVLDQVGSIQEFNELDLLSKQALAEASGVTIEQMQKSLSLMAMEDKFGAEAVKRAQELGMSAEELQDVKAGELNNLLAEKQLQADLAKEEQERSDQFQKGLVDQGLVFLEFLDRMKPAFAAIGVVVGAIADVIAGIVYSFEQMMNLITLNTDGMNTMQMVIGAIASIFTGMLITVGAINAAKRIALALDLKSLAYGVRGLGQLIGRAIAGIGSAIGPIFAGFSILGPAGPVLAGAAVATMTALAMSQINKAKAQKAGDLAMGANGGPVVMSPREGTIFQGTKNDEIAMGPGVIGSAQNTGTVVATAAGNADMSGVIAAINDLKKAIMNMPQPTINMDGREVAAVVRTNDSYRKR